MSQRNAKYKMLTVKDKLRAISEIEGGKLQRDVAHKFGIKPNIPTLSTILKNREKIRLQLQKHPDMAIKKAGSTMNILWMRKITFR